LADFQHAANLGTLNFADSQLNDGLDHTGQADAQQLRRSREPEPLLFGEGSAKDLNVNQPNGDLPGSDDLPQSTDRPVAGLISGVMERFDHTFKFIQRGPRRPEGRGMRRCGLLTVLATQLATRNMVEVPADVLKAHRYLRSCHSSDCGGQGDLEKCKGREAFEKARAELKNMKHWRATMDAFAAAVESMKGGVCTLILPAAGEASASLPQLINKAMELFQDIRIRTVIMNLLIAGYALTALAQVGAI